MFRLFHKAIIRQRHKNIRESEHFIYLFTCPVTRHNGMSHPKEAVEFLDGESALFKAFAIKTHGHAKVNEIGNAPSLVRTRPSKPVQPPGSDVLLVVNARQNSNTR
jgi:hypothetical protein